MASDQLFQILVRTADTFLFEQPPDFADGVIGFARENGIGDFAAGAQPLQSAFADFQERAHIIAVHPFLVGILLVVGSVLRNELGYRVELRRKFPIRFRFDRYDFHSPK